MRIATRVALLGACLTAASPSFAGVIPFNPYGNGVSASNIQVAYFDFLPGSTLEKGILPTTVGTTATIYFQARLGSFLDNNNNPILVPGLNDTTNANHFVLTVTAQYNVTVISTSTAGNTQTTITSLAAGAPSVINFYYDNTTATFPVALAGTNYNVGTLIATATPNSVTSVFTQITSAPTSNFDLVNNDYPGISTITGIGGTTFINSNVTFANSSWFLAPGIASINTNTSDALPFNQTDPSKNFFGTTPSIGLTNGSSGPDLELQSDANSSFVLVPEPASLALLALGGTSLLKRRRK